MSGLTGNPIKQASNGEAPRRDPLTDPETGTTLEQRAQPGYYPGFSTLSQQKYWDEATRTLILKRVSQVPPARFFTPEEERTWTAVMDRVIPQEDRTPDRRIPILPFLDERLAENKIDGYRYADMPSDQEAYRIGAHGFERMAQELHGKRFDELGTMQQEEILHSIHKAKPIAAEDAWKRVNLERFWSLVVTDAATVYYAHPWAWDEVGFGGPAYPRGYMRLEEGEPEPWERDEQRYAWAAPRDTLSDREEPMGTGQEHQTPHGEGGTH